MCVGKDENKWKREKNNLPKQKGGSHILVVLRGDQCSEAQGFESQYCIMDGYFSH